MRQWDITQVVTADSIICSSGPGPDYAGCHAPLWLTKLSVARTGLSDGGAIVSSVTSTGGRETKPLCSHTPLAGWGNCMYWVLHSKLILHVFVLRGIYKNLTTVYCHAVLISDFNLVFQVRSLVITTYNGIQEGFDWLLAATHS